MTEHQILHTIAQAAQANDWTVYAVGGWVRDQLLGVDSKDLDVEFFGPTDLFELSEWWLSEFGELVDEHGAKFSVVQAKIDGITVDCSLPRTEHKTGTGHKGFDVFVDPTMTIEQALARRDYTVNAIAYDPLVDKYIDPYSGLFDLRRKNLRHTSDQFSDDPLRVLRGMQFAGRFDLSPTKATTELCYGLYDAFHELPVERIWVEWEKFALYSVKPSAGIQFLVDTNWICHFPELLTLYTEQDSEWHPEGNALTHTMLALDYSIKFDLDDRERLILFFAVLLHDIGKARTTELCSDGHIRSPGHDKVGEPLAMQFLERIGAPLWLQGVVPLLVREHTVHFHTRKPTPRSVRRLARRLEPANITQLLRVMECDQRGRGDFEAPLPEAFYTIRELAENMAVENKGPDPILMGRHLIDLGWKPGVHFGPVLDDAEERQLDGEITDLESAIQWVKDNYKDGA
jgi:tRNA nucleotidyltransferase (CCA-adding enzyme)